MADYRKVEIWDATNVDNPYIARMNINESLQHNRNTSSQTTHILTSSAKRLISVKLYL